MAGDFDRIELANSETMDEENAVKDRKTKTALRVVRRNDRLQIKRVLAGGGQALLPMLELLEGAQASIDKLMHDTAGARVRDILVAGVCKRRQAQVLPQAAVTEGCPRARCRGASSRPARRSWPRLASAA